MIKIKEDSEKTDLKLSIQNTKTMASGCITPWQIEGKKVETVTEFLFLDSQITADGDCSHEIKRCLLLGRKTTTNLDSTLKSRDITLPTKVRLVKTVVFPVVMYRCELGLPRWHSGKESACQGRICKRHSFDLWVGKIPWSRKWQPTPVFLAGKFHGQRNLAGYSP